MHPRRASSTVPALLLLTAATLVVHGRTLSNGFVWDDEAIVVENPVTRDISQLGTVILSPDVTRPYYRPLSRATFLLDYQLFGMNARAFHAVNVLAHLASVLLLFALCVRLFEATWPALLSAMLLAVHPIHVEAVAFVSARNNLLALVFSLASTLLLMRAVDRRGWALAAASGLTFFLGLASKEQGAMVLPVLGSWLLLAPGARTLRARGLYLLVPHVFMLGVYLVARSLAVGGPTAGESILPGLAGRLARNYYVVPEYLRLVLFPVRLSIFHEVPEGYPAIGWLPLAWVGILGSLALLLRRPSEASSFGLLWTVLNLVPVMGLVPLPSSTGVAERFVHASVVGLWIVLGDVLHRIFPGRPPRAAWASMGAVLLALGARTVTRAGDWRDDLTLHRSAVRAEPSSLVARFNLGVALKDAGDLDGARREWEAALAIAPSDPGTHTQLGTLTAREGRLDEAEAHYRAALRVDPRLAEAVLNLARICERTGRRDEAVELYGQALAGGISATDEVAAQARAGLERLGFRSR